MTFEKLEEYMRQSSCLWLSLGLSVTACWGEVAQSALDPPSAMMNRGGSEMIRPPGEARASGTDKPPATPGALPPGLGRTPLRRLSRAEYINTVRAAFGTITPVIDAASLPLDELVAGYSGQSTDLVDDDKLGGYLDVASKVAAAIASDSDRFLAPCRRTDRGDTACVTDLLRRVLPILYRRPVPDAELQALVSSSFTPLTAPHGFAAGLEGAVTRMLLAPDFLFKLERGRTPAVARPPGILELQDHELATRLAYFLWKAPPDQALLDAARRGRLRDAGALEQELARMFDDPRARSTLESFHIEWLKLTELHERQKESALYPRWSEELRRSMLEETVRFLDHVVRQDRGSWKDILTAPFSFVDKNLAALYGVAGPGDGFAQVPLQAGARRAGVLAQAAFLTAHSHAEDTQMIHRGLMVRERLLCEELPFPDNVDTSQKVDRLNAPQCGGCHKLIEAIGLGFESYDGIGQWRDRAATGTLVGLPGGDRSFSSVLELGTILAESPSTLACLARQYFRFALGRAELAAPAGTPGDEASIREAAAAATRDGSVRSLVTALVASESFQLAHVEPSGACSTQP